MGYLETSNKPAATVVTDPVCRMEVYLGPTRHVAIFRGCTYWFCSADCRTAFEMNPRKYVDTKEGERKGWIRRNLGRMVKANGGLIGGVASKSG